LVNTKKESFKKECSKLISFKNIMIIKGFTDNDVKSIKLVEKIDSDSRYHLKTKEELKVNAKMKLYH